MLPCECQGVLLLVALLLGHVHDAVRGALLELQARHRLLDAGVGEIKELLGGEVLQVDLVELAGSHEHRVVSEVDRLGWLVSGELVPEHEVTSLVAPLQDGHQVLISGAQINLALRKQRYVKRVI